MKIFSRLLQFLSFLAFIAGLAFITNLFSAKQIIGYFKPVEVATIAPTPTPAILPKIAEAKVGQDCQFNVKTDQGELKFPTNFDPTVAQCEQYVINKVSPDGQYAAFEDLSASGIDSLIKVFSYKLQKVTLLHDLNQYSILDFTFLDNNQLAVLISDGLKGKQAIYVYNLQFLFDQYEPEAQEGEFSAQALRLATGELSITGGSKRAAYIKLVDQQLQVFAQDDE